MRKSILLTRANLRRGRGQMVTIFILVFLAALMLNLWLMLSMDYHRNFERYHDRLHAQHVTLVVDDDSEEMHDFLTRELGKNQQTNEFDLGDALNMPGSFLYNGGEMNHDFVISEKEEALSRSIGRVEITEEGEGKSGVYLPLLYQSEDIRIGKTIDITIAGNKIPYKVCGFFNSIMVGSHNCAMTEIILTDDKYQELAKLEYAQNATMCCVRIHDKMESQNYEAWLKDALSGRYPDARILSNTYLLVRQSRYVAASICSGIISMMAFLVLLIALVVISSNIMNYIAENMKNLGSLKAIGYISRQLVNSLMLQFLGFSLLAAVVGTGGSYMMFPYVNAMLASQTGIPYQTRFLPLPLLLTFAVLCGAVAVVVCLSSRRMKRVEPMVALRQGIQTHNFKRNHIPLAKSRVPLNAALALKTTFSGMKQNIIIGITMLVLSLVVVFSGVLIENMLVDSEPMVNLIVGETSDSCINVNLGKEEEFCEEMDKDARVENYYIYHYENVIHEGGLELLAMMCDDFSKTSNQDVVFEGRAPKFDNEIVIAAKYAKEQGLDIGDEMSIIAGGNEEKYMISGFTQISNQLGKDCLLTREGYERIGELQNVSYYLNFRDNVDIDKFNEEVKEMFGNEVNATINARATVKSGVSVYISIMTIIVTGILIMSVIVIAFVLYLLVRTMLNRKKQEYGILKAFGFTTRQLVLQTALSFMPAVVLSTVVGIAGNCAIINPLIALFLSGVGVVKCSFAIPVGLITVSGAGLVLLAFAIACLLSVRIKKIVPKELLSGD